MPGEVETPGQVVEVPREPTRVFVGRAEQLDRLNALVTEPGTRDVVISQAVHGLGGVGKSELALQFAHLHRDHYPVVWWVIADDAESIEAGLAALARTLVPEAARESPPSDAARWAVDWLNCHPGWLLVFDNVTVPTHIERWLAILTGGHVLITSRRDVRWPGTTTTLRLDVLDEDSAVELLTQVSGHTDPAGYDLPARIAGELGYLPLALDQAAAFIQQTHTTLERYLRLLRDQPFQVYEAAADGDKTQATIARLWDITMQALAETAPDSIALIRVLACYHPEDIPRILAYPSVGTDEVAIDRALGLLVSHSLITLTDDLISMHRLTQAVILHATPGIESRDVALAGLLAALPPDPQFNIDGWPRWRALLPHVEPATSRYLAGEQPTNLETLLNQTGQFYLVQGQARQAERLLTTAVEIAVAAHGSDHPEAATSVGNLAAAYIALGQPGKAKPLAERALAIAEAAYGPDHPIVGHWLGNLAGTYQELGQPGEAKPLAERALAIAEAAYGPDHPGVAIWLGNLAGTYSDLGQPAEAKPRFERALAIAETVYGPDHPTVGKWLKDLAATYQELGQPGEAKPLAERALAIVEAVYGPDHPTIGQWLESLAALYRELGQPGEAKSLAERALAIAEADQGPDHPDVANALGNLAGTYQELGQPGEAKSLAERALAIVEAVYGPDHPTIGQWLESLAALYHELGQPGEAKPLAERALAIAEADQGPDHPDVAITLGNLAAICSDLGQLSEAKARLEHALAISLAAYGPDHPHVLTWLENLVIICHDLGDEDAADAAVTQFAEQYAKRTLGVEHPTTQLLQQFGESLKPSTEC
ncbi:FxSxx-COOH system tetratricopeptide repeat protein [Actinomadura sp. 9N407]|uniref:FxSxx-COOH system tetratricopeptide repeat protein n=1 Tax=Actinomadura sp. 9N407 TaxID=3375154 RepID=UPI0037BBFAF2